MSASKFMKPLYKNGPLKRSEREKEEKKESLRDWLRKGYKKNYENLVLLK